ncbi:MAG: hypothetical protein JSW03_04320 [Candidatus Eiseniibacteriota bacterium]|nr:MAG: hypothetical protein JSW03_04320 [Candidatus Eisenbacteria bacterium]
MNIFVLDRNVRKCARYHADQHVVKMILESAQMLCSVLWQHGVEAPYKSTHAKHPCTLWAGESLSNWKWLHRLALALNDEYRYRFGRDCDHESAAVVRKLPLPPIKDAGLTEFPQVVPERCRIPSDSVAAYRQFYVEDKSRFATWTRRRAPKWFRNALRRDV